MKITKKRTIQHSSKSHFTYLAAGNGMQVMQVPNTCEQVHNDLCHRKPQSRSCKLPCRNHELHESSPHVANMKSTITKFTCNHEVAMSQACMDYVAMHVADREVASHEVPMQSRSQTIVMSPITKSPCNIAITKSPCRNHEVRKNAKTQYDSTR